MQDRFTEGVEQIQSLSKPTRLALLATLWLFTVGVVALINGLPAAVLASTVAVSFVWLLKPYHDQHPDKNALALLLSMIDVRRPSRCERLLAVGGVLAVIGSELLLGLVLGLLESQAPAGHSITSTVDSSPGVVVLAGLFLSAAVIAPIMEEFVFRNGLQKLLALRVGDIGAILVTSTLFASLHVPAYGGLGVGLASLALPLSVVFTGSVVFGTLYWRTRNVVVPMLSHGLFNGFALVFTLLA